MGVTVIDTMKKVLAGETVPEIILTPSVVVTPENLADYLAGKLWTEPVAGAPETDNDKPTVPESRRSPLPRPREGGIRRLCAAGADQPVPRRHGGRRDRRARRSSAGSSTSRPRPSKATSRPSSPPSSNCCRRASRPSRINPIGTDSAVTAVKAANEKGVPILAHNFITPFSEGKVVSYIGYDQWGGAEKLAKTTCDLIAKKYNTTADKTTGKVFILLGIDSIFSHRRTGGFKAGLTKYCPNVKVVGEQTAEWLRTKGSEVATIAWQKDPDIDVFYGNSDEMAIGAGLAGEQLGKVINKDFFAVGIDGNQPTLDLLKQGKFSATLGVDPFRMGVTVIDTMQKVLAGENRARDHPDPLRRRHPGEPGRLSGRQALDRSGRRLTRDRQRQAHRPR